MSVELHFNGINDVTACRAFHCLIAPKRWASTCRLPAARMANASECVVEVTEGMDCLSGRLPAEKHLKGNFRLSCSLLNHCQGHRRRSMPHDAKGRNADRGPRDTKPSSVLTHQHPKLDPCITRVGRTVLCWMARRSTAPSGPITDLQWTGTTTVVLRLLNLETGEIVADSSFENPQRFGGSEVMSRIQYDTEHEGKLLQRTLAGYVRHAIEGLKVDPKSIYEMVVAGNSTMRDLFFRLDVYSIGQNPYRSITEIEMR